MHRWLCFEFGIARASEKKKTDNHLKTCLISSVNNLVSVNDRVDVIMQLKKKKRKEKNNGCCWISCEL